MHASPLPPLADPATRNVALLRLRVGMGDLLCTVPALRSLRRVRPDVRIVLVTWREVAPVVDRMSAYVDELLDFPGYPGIPERPPAPSWERWVCEVRARRFDLAVQMYGDNPAANDVTAAVGARFVGGFAPTAGPARDLATHLPYPHEDHEIRRHLRLLELLGVPRSAGDEVLEFALTDADEQGAARLRAAAGLERGRYVVLHPGATSGSRRWPADRFAAVGDALAAQGLDVVVAGVRGEEEVTSAVLRAMRRPAVDLTARTTLGEYAVLLRDAAALVANDTGSAHLCAAVGGRSVTVFLSGDPRRWRHAPELQSVARVDVGCNPCHHLVCPIDFRCADRVTVPHVLELVTGHLPARR
ncbi:MAG: glycosyltransferase family 9 protein [Actinomycetota bacterium]|nr:glycosyltransferase family 9 protein [Actinomycetota bacterium]